MLKNDFLLQATIIHPHFLVPRNFWNENWHTRQEFDVTTKRSTGIKVVVTYFQLELQKLPGGVGLGLFNAYQQELEMRRPIQSSSYMMYEQELEQFESRMVFSLACIPWKYSPRVP